MGRNREGVGRYAGGRDCHNCGENVAVYDKYCRCCGERLRKTMLDKLDRRPPEPPDGISVFQPQQADYLVLRTPDGTYRVEPDEAAGLGTILLERAATIEDSGGTCPDCGSSELTVGEDGSSAACPNCGFAAEDDDSA